MARWQRPTIDTKFHIDLAWWEQTGQDLRLYVSQALCDECRADLGGYEGERLIDWVDEFTGQVRRVDGLWHALNTCCSTRPDYITPNTPIVESIFRTFLANGNTPLSIRELYELLDRRPPELILRMLTAGQVYLGLRPVD
jgi:hypothetical protein